MVIWVLEGGYVNQGGGVHSLYKNVGDVLSIIDGIVKEGNADNIKKFNSLSDEDKELYKEPAEFVKVQHNDSTISWSDGLNYVSLREMEVIE